MASVVVVAGVGTVASVPVVLGVSGCEWSVVSGFDAPTALVVVVAAASSGVAVAVVLWVDAESNDVFVD